MECEQTTGDSCPCPLAEVAECPYCSLLRGESLCKCDWQGWCAYERCRWRDGAAAPPPAGTVVGVRTYPAGLGLVVKTDEGLTAAAPGTLVRMRLPGAGGREVAAVILATYASGFAYLLLPLPYPGRALVGETLRLTAAGNDFAGYAALAGCGRSVVVAAEPSLAEMLGPLAAGLRRRGNEVAVVAPADLAAWGGADVVFAAGRVNEIKRATTALPPSFRGKVVIWATGGLSPLS